MSHFFISYSRKDSHFVNRLANDLLGIGQQIWVDTRNIPLGEEWEAEIRKGLDSATHVLVICSPDSAASENVKKEIEIALRLRKPIIPLLYRGEYGDMPDDLLIDRKNGHDFSGRYDNAWHSFKAHMFPNGVPVNLQELLQDGTQKFGESSQLWPNSRIEDDRAYIPLAGGAYGLSAHLIGREYDDLRAPEVVQVALQFSRGGNDEKDFLADVISYLRAHNRRLWLVYVEGPRNSNREFDLPVDRYVWEASIEFVWLAIGRSRIRTTPLQFFMAGPVALGIGLGAHQHHKTVVEVYHQIRGKKDGEAYECVYRLEPQ